MTPASDVPAGFILGDGDRQFVGRAHPAVGLIADVDCVILAIGADAPGAEKPSPAGEAVSSHERSSAVAAVPISAAQASIKLPRSLGERAARPSWR
jgi:hypothetical protein